MVNTHNSEETQARMKVEEESPRIDVETAVLSMTEDQVGESDAKSASTVFEVSQLNVYYGDFCALRDVNLDVTQSEVTAFIGPSGCGKSTFLRCFNRMNDLIETARVEGQVRYHGVDLYQSEVDAVEVRRRIGMVFQKPNPFPKSIYDNIAFGPRIAGAKKSEIDDIVERSPVKP